MAQRLSLAVLLVLACTALAQQQGPNQGTNYNTGDSGRSEQVNPDGSVQGQYSYTDPNGKLITLKYRAGKDGFQVEGDHLPKAPVPQAPAPQPQQQYNQEPQQQYNQQPQQQYNNNNQQQQQGSLPASTFFSGQQGGFPQQPQQFNNYQHPNALPQSQSQYNPFQNQQPQQGLLNNQGAQGEQYNSNNGASRGAKVSVSQQPGQGFSYTYES